MADRSFAYSDGDDESWLHQQIVVLGKSDPLDLIAARPTWPVTVHCSPQRPVLLKHVPIRGRVLEIGAGLGALTGYLTTVADHVVALEPPERRAEIIRARYAQAQNLQVIAGSLQDAGNQLGQFDTVLCVGVLEYSGKYVQAPDPFATFLRQCVARLAPGGQLVLAIENKLGYKYLSGAHEDHYGTFAQGLENYPNYNGTRTFSRKELSQLLEGSGLHGLDWHYPVPDYKLPIEIYAHDYFVEQFSPTNETIPSEMPQNPRQYLVQENLLVSSLVQAGTLPEHANSFLVVATREPANPLTAKTRTLYTREQTAKRLDQRSLTRVIQENDRRIVVRTRTNAAALADMLEAYEAIPREGFYVPNLIGRPTPTAAAFAYVAGPTLADLLFWALLERRIKDAEALLTAFRQAAERLCTHPNELPRAFDLALSNVVLSNGRLYLVDVETLLDEPASLDIALLRAVHMYSRNLQEVFARCVAPDQLVDVQGHAVPRLLCDALGLNPAQLLTRYQAQEKRIVARYLEPRVRDSVRV